MTTHPASAAFVGPPCDPNPSAGSAVGATAWRPPTRCVWDRILGGLSAGWRVGAPRRALPLQAMLPGGGQQECAAAH